MREQVIDDIKGRIEQERKREETPQWCKVTIM